MDRSAHATHTHPNPSPFTGHLSLLSSRFGHSSAIFKYGDYYRARGAHSGDNITITCGNASIRLPNSSGYRRLRGTGTIVRIISLRVDVDKLHGFQEIERGAAGLYLRPHSAGVALAPVVVLLLAMSASNHEDTARRLAQAAGYSVPMLVGVEAFPLLIFFTMLYMLVIRLRLIGAGRERRNPF